MATIEVVRSVIEVKLELTMEEADLIRYALFDVYYRTSVATPSGTAQRTAIVELLTPFRHALHDTAEDTTGRVNKRFAC